MLTMSCPYWYMCMNALTYSFTGNEIRNGSSDIPMTSYKIQKKMMPSLSFS